jgi:hypothetical protein
MFERLQKKLRIAVLKTTSASLKPLNEGRDTSHPYFVIIDSNFDNKIMLIKESKHDYVVRYLLGENILSEEAANMMMEKSWDFFKKVKRFDKNQCVVFLSGLNEMAGCSPYMRKDEAAELMYMWAEIIASDLI